MPTSQNAQAITLDGPDAIAFAHNQFTSPVTALAVGRWQFSSWLDAQGRVRQLFHLARIGEERLLLILRGGDAAEFVEALRRFVFRSRVTLSVAEGSLTDASVLPLHHVKAHDDVIVLGCGSHAMQFGNNVDKTHGWRLEQLHAGWPWLPDAALNELLPPALSLHRLGAIALDKGCYPGQEIVARLHYRGGNKKHLHRVELSQRVEEGSLLQHNDREFIRLLQVMPHADRIEALAVMTDDVANDIVQHSKNANHEHSDLRIVSTWSD
ncbi:folate-binding protein [Dyella sp. 2HG41-7]|uniref:CAF17-like 4Fe-4S cluster assembly/insertion protein YgfZ n=1 Tax=Dyella sp. 2HG41-7 TaxID=2883239 RepID=UPI001F2EF441|nr:folate-binding protein [Dyella sp. 2HG41-7]